MPLNILYAEDDDTMRTFMVRALTAQGWIVHAFSNGLSAKAHFEQNGTDILLTDIVMPGMDGYELAQHIRRKSPTTPVIYMTGFMGMEGGDGQASALLQKPFHIGQLIKRIQDLCPDTEIPPPS
jgi:two-component system cell cycle response regulator CpdR